MTDSISCAVSGHSSPDLTNRAHTNFDFLLIPFRSFATQRFLIAGKLLNPN